MCEKQRSIPKLEMPTETQLGQIVIMHSDEKMVNVKEMGEERIIFEPVYFRKGYQNATPNCYMRYRVFQKLQAAVQALEEEYCLKIFDAWRPYRLQMELYLEFYEKVRQQYAEESEEQIRSRVRQFVSIPSQDRNRPYAHGTGGAVDLTICYADGRELDMGTGFDDFTEKSNTAYYEVEGREGKIRENRRKLYHLMCGAGFTNLPSEWWHYDYGDRFYAYYTKRESAEFGGILEYEKESTEKS